MNIIIFYAFRYINYINIIYNFLYIIYILIYNFLYIIENIIKIYIIKFIYFNNSFTNNNHVKLCIII